MNDNERPIPDLSAIRVQLPLYIHAIPVPLHEGIALLLESKQLGLIRWELTIEQSRHLVRVLNQCLADLSP
jgi:hypothetical protein